MRGLHREWEGGFYFSTPPFGWGKVLKWTEETLHTLTNTGTHPLPPPPSLSLIPAFFPTVQLNNTKHLQPQTQNVHFALHTLRPKIRCVFEYLAAIFCSGEQG